MIHKIFSSLPRFKTLSFEPGLNIVHASKSAGASRKDTRNRAGKSSILEIVHFLTAGSCDKDSIFRSDALRDHWFGMEFDLGTSDVTVLRTGSEKSKVRIVAGDVAGWPVEPREDKDSGQLVISNSNYEKVLGNLIFGLPVSGYGTYGPTFRSLFPYFARRDPDGFIEPHQHFARGSRYQWQVAVSYLLGLDWEIAQKWQPIRDQEKQLEALQKAVGQTVLGEILGSASELRAALAVSERQVSTARRRVESFEVLEDYRAFEKEASEITSTLDDLANANTADEALIADLERSLSTEDVPTFDDLQRLYSEVGVVLPESAVKRFEDVRQFHESVIRNRRSYLEGELTAARQRVSERNSRKSSLAGRRQELLGLLRSKGALDQLTKLQRELTRKEADHEELRRKHDAAQKLESGTARLEIERNELLLRLQQDYAEEQERLDHAIVVFEEISSAIYRKPARLTPVETPNGPEFKIEVHGERSPGVWHMQIFTFDLMLAQLQAERGIGPGFLIHDSHLFDPVDGRQVGSGLEIAAQLAKEYGFQYIVTLNTDKEIETSDDFDLNDYVNPTTLTDDTKTGGLFGLRFA